MIADHTPDAQQCNETHQFLCADGRKCVPSVWICNNETDCYDGSDEFNCSMPVEYDNVSISFVILFILRFTYMYIFKYLS